MYKLTFTLSLLFSVTALANASPWSTLRSCVPMIVPIFRAGTPQYQALKKLSFVNNRFEPVAISKPRNVGDVKKLVRCARAAGVSVCARSGGHSFLGANLCPGLSIDLQNLRAVRMIGTTVANIEMGANMGEVLWQLHKWKRWFPSGVCPSVGVGGFTPGGGIGPYMSKIGLACDSLLSVTLVNRMGDIIVASKTRRKTLFWGLCGAGGAQFGIAVSMRVKTVSSYRYDNAVIFRFNWNPSRVGELMSKWSKYNEANGKVWFRMEMTLARTEVGMNGYGACFNVNSTSACMNILKQAEFFRTPDRTTRFITKVPNALHLHAFYGPEGGWARHPAGNIHKAFLEQRNGMGGSGHGRAYQSSFVRTKKNGKSMSRAFWQKYGDFCANPGRWGIPWVVCELNLIQNTVRRPRDNAFAHRNADILTHYIIGGGSEVDKRYVYNWMRNHLQAFSTGAYVNYPEPELKSNYAMAYWGSSLERLKKLKRRYDPTLFFFNPQPIPI